jgi:phosphoribosyl-ATP pyrophosphohydrolase
MSLNELEAVLRRRRTSAPAGSYSATLVSAPDRASRKVMEEAYELCYELTRPAIDRQRVTEEAADLLFHVLAGLVADEVLAELEARRGGSAGHLSADGPAAGSPAGDTADARPGE